LPPLVSLDDPVPHSSSTIKRSAASAAPAADARVAEDEDEDGEVEVEDIPENGEDEGMDRPAKKLKPQTKTTSKKSKEVVPGIIYISRVPPGMTPQKVRHLMARWGEVGKVYAQKRDGEWDSLLRDRNSICLVNPQLESESGGVVGGQVVPSWDDLRTLTHLHRLINLVLI
jgi:hypothetical protein